MPIVSYPPTSPGFDPIEPAPRTSLWRYLELWKLAHLLQTSKLWFPRITELGDPFEGSALRYADDPRVGRLPEARRGLRNVLYVSCWCASRYESAALWGLYGGPHGVAIRSTAARLREALEPYEAPVYLGRVRYLDYRRPIRARPDDLGLTVFAKRRSFAHEQEVRAVAWLDPGVTARARKRVETPLGLAVPVDLKRLINAVYVSPRASDAVLDTVRGLVGRAWPVHRSDLDREPVF